MKKIFLCCLLFLIFSNGYSQIGSKHLKEIGTRQPRLIPNIGYSFETGRIGKGGIWLKLYKNIYFETAFAIFNKSRDAKNSYPGSYVIEKRYKYLYGIDYIIDKESCLFINTSYVRRITLYDAYDSFNNTSRKTKKFVAGISINGGRIFFLSKNKNRGLSMIVKGGLSFSTDLFYTIHLDRINPFPNFEISFAYSL
ncbi:MAG: hypothetical protein RL708_493 [Bacteroidota bacterium]|jgi:hypothetical protein